MNREERERFKEAKRLKNAGFSERSGKITKEMIMTKHAQELRESLDLKHDAFPRVDSIKPAHADCIIHTTVYLEPVPRPLSKSSAEREFDVFKVNLERFASTGLSRDAGFRSIFIIYIVGGLLDDKIEFFNGIDNTVIGNNMHVYVCQRPNIGWHWAGFWEVWSALKTTPCEWWISIEADVLINPGNWYDVARGWILGSDDPDKICYVGDCVGQRVNPDHWPADTWRAPGGEMVKPTADQLRHTNGGFYFCTRTFLEAMDKHYGCFTYARGLDKRLDCIGHGELGFCHKAMCLGFEYIATNNFVFTPLRKDYLQEISEWSKSRNYERVT